jgi:hypothetical protein
MPLLALRSLYEAAGGDVIVDLVGVSSRHGAGQITVDAGAVAPPEPGGSLGLIGPARRRRRRIVVPAPSPDVVIQPDGVSGNHGTDRLGIDVESGAAVPSGSGIGSPVIDVSSEITIPPRRGGVPGAFIDVSFQAAPPSRGRGTKRGIGRVTVETPFDITDDEMLAIMMLVA